MRYLQIPDYLLNDIPELLDLIWPTYHTIHEDADDGYYDNYIIRGEVHMIPETHPNIAFILLKIGAHHWYDEESGPYKFMKFV